MTSKHQSDIQTDTALAPGVYRPGADTDQGPTPPPQALRSLFAFLWAFAAIAISVAAWSIATPLIAAPDEATQVAQAAALVRGQFDMPVQPGPTGAMARVEVPESVRSAYSVSRCFAFQPHVSAGCAPKINSAVNTVTTVTQFSNYPPLYYLIIGVPTLVSAGTGAIYAMRLTAVVINAGLIGLGLFLLSRYHPRRLPLLGALVALTPMVLFMSAVVNASGMEIAAAYAAWCGGLCIIELPTLPRPLIVGTTISFVVLIISRPISPVNAAVILVVLATLAGWQRTRALLGERGGRYLAGAVLTAMVVAGIFLLIGGLPSLLGYPEKPPLSLTASMWLTLKWTQHRLRQCIGEFGWLDISVPLLVFVVWLAALGGLATFALALCKGCRRALPLLCLAILVMPVIFESPQINKVGTYWQGRYWLPLAVGLPLVASAMSPRMRSRHARRSLSPHLTLVGAVIFSACLVTAQLAAFLTALHRYQTGTGAAPGTPVHWAPPGGVAFSVGFCLFGQVLLTAFVAWKWAHKVPVLPLADTPADGTGGKQLAPVSWS
jgi:hypothetical protein